MASEQEHALRGELAEAAAQQDTLRQGLEAAQEAASQAASSSAAQRDRVWQQVRYLQQARRQLRPQVQAMEG